MANIYKLFWPAIDLGGVDISINSPCCCGK